MAACVARPADHRLAINVNTAESLGLAIPQALLATAYELIQ